MDYFNSAPLNIEAADISRKGKDYANFLMGFWSTNKPKGGLTVAHTSCPLAFWRRFQYRVDVVPKPEFCQSGVLESSLIPPNTVELWSKITLRKFHPDLMNKSMPLESEPYDAGVEYTSVIEFSRELSEILKVHVDRHKAHISAANHTDGRCAFCNISLDSHGATVCYQSLVTDVAIFSVVLLPWIYFIGSMMKEISIVRAHLLSYGQRRIDEIAVRVQDLITLESVDSLLQRRIRAINFPRATLVRNLVLGSAAFYMALRAMQATYSAQPQATAETNVPVPNLHPSTSGWLRKTQQPSFPYINAQRSTYSQADLQQIIRDNLVEITFNGRTCFGWVIGRGFIVTVYHIFESSNKLVDYSKKLRVVVKAQRVEVEISPAILRQVPGKDLALLHVPEIVPLATLWRKLPTTSQIVPKMRADRAYLVTPTDLIEGSYANATSDMLNASQLCWVSDISTVEGQCGLPLIGVFNNNFMIIGMHHILRRRAVCSEADAMDVSQNDLAPLMEEMDKELTKVVEVVYHTRDISLQGVNFVPYPPKSSVWAQQSHDAPVSLLQL
jgi:hypothetical protein